MKRCLQKRILFEELDVTPKFQPLYYTDQSKGLIYLLCTLAIMFSPLINFIHGTYFANIASMYHYFPHEYDYNGLIWDLCLRALVIWWVVKPFYIKVCSNLTWTQVLYTCAYLFVTFIFFAYPAVTGFFGNILRSMLIFGNDFFRVPQFIANFLSLFLTSVVGMTICELVSLRCGHMIQDKHLFYWSCKELIVNTIIVSVSLTYVLWQQGYVL